MLFSQDITVGFNALYFDAERRGIEPSARINTIVFPLNFLYLTPYISKTKYVLILSIHKNKQSRSTHSGFKSRPYLKKESFRK